MYNKIILAGNLTRDIEIRLTPGGAAVGNSAIATTHKYKGQDGTQKEEVLFIDIAFFGRAAEIANQYLRKGSKVLVDGRLKLYQWIAEDGSKRSKHSVIVENLKMLDTKQPADSAAGVPVEEQDMAGNTVATYNAPAPQQQAQQQSVPEIDISEDEIPF